MTYAEPYVPRDYKMIRAWAIAGLAWVAIFWLVIVPLFAIAISNADTRPDACAGLSAAECGEAVTK